ncbi:hypothetical protein RIF29_30100 [Crotalaria pallida]|uniref:Uncharacterized protein n=1 Tax=Crotalaria pallida TaxID=3830 RepID=A0AAN9I105_CROPI
MLFTFHTVFSAQSPKSGFNQVMRSTRDRNNSHGLSLSSPPQSKFSLSHHHSMTPHFHHWAPPHPHPSPSPFFVAPTLPFSLSLCTSISLDSTPQNR